MNNNKNFKIFGVRQNLIGDCVGAIPTLNFLSGYFKNPYIYWQISKKIAHCAPLFISHPLIDKIVISDCHEGIGPKDREIMATCEVVINTMPQHPEGDGWPNQFSFYEETFRMSGFDLSFYQNLPEEEKYPKLYKWFNNECLPVNHDKVASIYPAAACGREAKRSMSIEWYEKLCETLIKKGFFVLILGHPNDPKLFMGKTEPKNFACANHLDYFQQVRISLSSKIIFSTDSGSGIIASAYGHPNINIIRKHWPGHEKNLLAFAPRGINTHNFLGDGSDSQIDEIANTANLII